MRPAILALALLAAAPALHAQATTAPLAAGQLVRVRLARETPPFLAGYRSTGVIERLDGDSLVLRVADADVAFPRAAIGRLEVHEGRRSRGALVGMGLLVGLGGGAVAGAAIGSTASNDGFFGPEFPEAVGAFFGGIAGGVGGLIWGASRPLDRWAAVPLNAATRVGVVATSRGVGLAMRF